MTDFNNRPTYLADLLKGMETPRPFVDRLWLWAVTGMSWKATKMRGVSIHGLSTATYARWDAAATDTYGGRFPRETVPTDSEGPE